MGSLHLYVADEARAHGYDRTTARNARRGLRLALSTSRGILRGRDMRHAEMCARWNYPATPHRGDRLHPDRVAWRIGHHAGRAFAMAEIRYDAAQRFWRPERKLAELAARARVDRTTLAAIINASSVIADRLEFLHGLESVLFDPETKGLLKERTQLHKLLEQNTWIFGEEFHLTASDEGLTKCLGKHLKLLTGQEPKKLVPVKTSTGQPQILDLFLSRRIPMLGDERHHLIIELKRPTVAIDQDVLTQVKKYARSVANDERFRSTRVRWTFWAVSNEMDDLAQTEANQVNRPRGVVQQVEGATPYTIWAKTWAQLLDEARARLEFFREKLEYQANHESGRKYLKDVYENLLP